MLCELFITCCTNGTLIMNPFTEEWMGRLRLAAIGCNYREVDRQLKEQFLHGLNDNDMLAEIIRELTKAEESADITSHQVLGWAKRVEAQRAICNIGQFN